MTDMTYNLDSLYANNIDLNDYTLPEEYETDITLPLSPEDDVTRDVSSMQYVENCNSTQDVHNVLLQPQPFQIYQPDAPRYNPEEPPARTPYDTNYKFKVSISSVNINKKKYLYSLRLNRVYVDMNCDFPVNFECDRCAGPHPDYKLFVRATMVFSDDEYCQRRVERCLQHYHDNKVNIPDHIKKHVLRSSREIGTEGVTYHGDPNKVGSWYSVLVELGTRQTQHAYKFVCKNSCNSGINRRATAIVFTLEDELGYILGRQIVGVRVCSCPRRDLTKDEETLGEYKEGKKRVSSNRIEPPKSKKVKCEPASVEAPDNRVITLPPIPVAGTRAAVAGLEMMVHMMKQAQSTDPDNQQYAISIAAVQNAVQEIKNAQEDKL